MEQFKSANILKSVWQTVKKNMNFNQISEREKKNIVYIDVVVDVDLWNSRPRCWDFASISSENSKTTFLCVLFGVSLWKSAKVYLKSVTLFDVEFRVQNNRTQFCKPTNAPIDCKQPNTHTKKTKLYSLIDLGLLDSIELISRLKKLWN